MNKILEALEKLDIEQKQIIKTEQQIIQEKKDEAIQRAIERAKKRKW